MAGPPYQFQEYIVICSSWSTAEIQIACQKLNDLAAQGYTLVCHAATGGTFVWTMGK